jgi:hypothetical protein
MYVGVADIQGAKGLILMDESNANAKIQGVQTSDYIASELLSTGNK